MTFRDDDLTHLEAHGMPPLPAATREGHVERDGARIWFAEFGAGTPVVLLHGGMGSSGDFSRLIPPLTAAGRRVIAIDSRGQGRSSWDGTAFSYRRMAADVRAVMDECGIDRAAIVGWSDGADAGLVLAQETPERVAGLFFFACNVDSTGTLPFVYTDVIGRILGHNKRSFAALSPTPDAFDTVFEAVGKMQSAQPELTAAELALIDVPATVALGEHDEFIRRDHLEYLATTLPDASFTLLPGVSHFAPMQHPELFNAAVLRFLERVRPD